MDFLEQNYVWMIDAAVAIPLLLALLFWSRGLWRQNKGDIYLSGLVFIVALIIYGCFYPVVTLTTLPWITMIGCAAVAAVIPATKRDQAFSIRSIAHILIPACLAAALFAADQFWSAPANSLMVIVPYRRAGTWVFDDPTTGLRGEPFVSGIPELIDNLVKDANIQGADKGFRLLFSMAPFPGQHERVVWRRQQDGGNWYYSEKYNLEGWLCPALFKYFKRPPKQIYVRVESMVKQPATPKENATKAEHLLSPGCQGTKPRQ